MKGLKRLLSFARRACDDYNMISEGDTVAVGLSGGKDSLALLYTMANLKKFYPVPFELIAVTIDMRFEEIGKGKTDFSQIEKLCEELGVKYYIEPSDIAKIVFDIRKESNPCSLCAKLRRGMLCDAAKRHGATKSPSVIILTTPFRPLCSTSSMRAGLGAFLRLLISTALT